MSAEPSNQRAAVRAQFHQATQPVSPDGLFAVIGHFDADGLAASALLCRSLRRAGRRCEARIVGKGETPWSESVQDELRSLRPAALVVTDLGVRAEPILDSCPTVFIDHHVPMSMPDDAVVISGYGSEPQPTSSLLAYWCAESLIDADDLLWLAAIGLVGDMAEDAGFPEMKLAQKRYGKTALRNAVSLINAPRRSSSADAAPAFALLMKCDSPKELLSGEHAKTALLVQAKEEVRCELDFAKRVPPEIRGEFALIRFSSPCQIHPLVAQQWRGRLKDKIVIAANTGYRSGWVHFAARTATGADLIAYLAERRPDGADEHYGSGHRQATGGALRTEVWNRFVDELGFPEEQIA